MKTGIKICTQGPLRRSGPDLWRQARVFNHRVGMAEIKDILARGHEPLAVGSEEGQMVVHFGPVLFTRRGAR